MTRTPDRTAPSYSLSPPDSLAVQLKTSTPMFGGSAQTRVVDSDHPVRAASVRGHLRFWWRATAGARFDTAQALFDAESALWGNTTLPGKVRVEVETLSAGQETQPVQHTARRDGKKGFDFGAYPAYALFPFQGTIKFGNTDETPARARENVEFRVILNCPPALHSEIETALNAWVLFGGIGARTRRGCGSLQLIGGDARLLQAVQKQEKLLTALPKSYLVGPPQKDALAAWAQAVALYRDFRQGVGFGRNEGQQQNRPGRSRYPEPDTLRDITGRYGHATIHPVRGFPRADLGLPIIFHFQDAQKLGEPLDLTLQGQETGQQRFASPVITKPVFSGGQWLPLVALLDSPHVWEGPPLELKGQRRIEAAEINLGQRELAQIRPLAGQPIRQALVAFAQQEGFRQVSL